MAAIMRNGRSQENHSQNQEEANLKGETKERHLNGEMETIMVDQMLNGEMEIP
jgi:hypothetical protein